MHRVYLYICVRIQYGLRPSGLGLRIRGETRKVIGICSTRETHRYQIFPTSVRARGLNFSASGGAIGSIIVAQVWPVGIDKIGSRIYFFFFAVNVVCVPVSNDIPRG